MFDLSATCSPPPKLYIALEGNIACGKSTVMDMLPSSYLTLVKEPEYTHFTKGSAIFDSEHEIKYNPTELLYTDPLKNAPLVQLHIMDKTEENHKTQYALSDKQIMVTERSIHVSPDIVIEGQRQSGFLSDFQKDFLTKEKDNHAVKLWHAEPSHYIYLRSPPELCFERIQDRNRKGEESITLDYINNLHDSHEKYFQKEFETNERKFEVVHIDESTTRGELTQKVEFAILSIWKDITMNIFGKCCV
jgi:deoxyadenosine/deoxycytidine kinase